MRLPVLPANSGSGRRGWWVSVKGRKMKNGFPALGVLVDIIDSFVGSFAIHQRALLEIVRLHHRRLAALAWWFILIRRKERRIRIKAHA